MSYLLDALNKSGADTPENHQTGHQPTQPLGQPSAQPMNQPLTAQQIMYNQAAFGQESLARDESSNIYKWISVVLALVLTLIVGYVLGNKFTILSALAPDSAEPVPLVAEQTQPIPVTAAKTILVAPVQTATAVLTPTVRPEAKPAVIAAPAVEEQQLVISGQRAQTNPATTESTTAINNNKDTGLGDISADLLKKFNAAIEQSESTSVEDDVTEQQQILQSGERIKQLFSDVTAIDQLDPEFQATIPDLTYGTHIYATDPRQRWVKINDNTLQEDQWINNEILVIEIQHQFVVLEMNHVRFSLSALTDWTQR
ncbi:MAG: general secretion pathway protein B [Phenylobacterium sp.]|jgi:general secretion pathway protein B